MNESNNNTATSLLGNIRVADCLNEIAERLEAQGANEFRVRAYRSAAETLRRLKQDVREILDARGYVPEISAEPAQFRSIQPAWNNVNLLHLARVSRSSVVLAHVRGRHPWAWRGLGVTESNCHPFAAGRFAFMHNGSIAEFRKSKRRFCDRLSDESYLWIHGTTDSEHLFALFRDHVNRLGGGSELDVMAEALASTIADVNELTCAVGASGGSLLNLAVSDGQRAVVSRYVTDDSEGPSLHLRTGTRYVCDNGTCRMLNDADLPATVIVASEPLTEEPGWSEVPRNHMVLIDSNRRVELRKLD